MNCPYCFEDMEKGFIDQTDIRFPLVWYPAKRETGFCRSTKRDIKLTSALEGGSVIAYHCARCKKFIIEHKLY